MTVAAAAPATPQPSTAMNTKSRTILEMPDASVVYSPTLGFPAVEASTWNVYWSMKSGSESIEMRP